jgi:iron complex transport system ATP-binding protein
MNSLARQVHTDRKPLLTISNLNIGYGKKSKMKTVAQNLEASMGGGKLICLLGSNGTGKSTLMRTISGFIPRLSGSIFIGGKETSGMTEKEMSKMLSVVLTDRIIVPNATVEELVGYGRSPYTGMLGRLKSHDDEVVDNAIEKCGISHKKYQTVSTLSDGERQKAFIAKALAQDTPIILLDEPTAFLDLPARVEVFQLLRHIASTEGKSILLSTHDLDLALQMADQLWLLFPSGPLVCGSPEDLLLDNTFQRLFSHRGIEFDNKTGLFTIRHEEQHTIQVKGHGFRYVLLRRAFARCGIKLDKYADDDIWIDISEEGAMKLKNREKTVADSTSIEQFVDMTKQYIENHHQEAKEPEFQNTHQS